MADGRGFRIPMDPLEHEQFFSKRIGDNFCLRFGNDPKQNEYYRIINKEPIPFMQKTATAWNLAKGATSDIGNVSQWLQPADGVLYLAKFGMLSDRNLRTYIRYSGGVGDLYGIKNQSSNFITEAISPFLAPRVMIRSWGRNLNMSFKIENPGEYTSTILKYSLQGYKYILQPYGMGKIPEHYDILSFWHISDGSEDTYGKVDEVQPTSYARR